LPEHHRVTVIEGWIENNRPALVAISISRPYYSSTSQDSILQSIQTNAKVIVTDSNTGVSETLSLGKSYDHIYGLLGKAYLGKTLKGVPGHTYLLHVENNGRHYHASTTVPLHTVKLDSLYFTRKGRSFLRIHFTDPAGEFNCYRFFTKVQGKEPTFSQVYIGTFDDLTFDGKQLNFELIRMPYSNLLSIQYKNLEDVKNATTFKKGDVVCVKSTMTDVDTKNFWFALQVDLAMTNNMFVSPGVYKSNIHESEGEKVSGIWSGYNARYDTIVCK
ncbi:MAG: DUF4249 family protein, partial [Bacteroidales bacterium]|nr:DUF4249 family protein [Bacteroidales bacterium]